MKHLAVKTAATQTKPAYAGYKTVDFRLVRVGGLRFYSRDSNRWSLEARCEHINA